MKTYVSLFSGIGGFDLGADRAGLQCVLQVEKDKDCLNVLNHHWPNVETVNDVKKVQQVTADVICGGFPCQDVSVAGRRAGLAGKQSGLWFEFHRIIASSLPRWVVIENVPGLLSSNNGRDIQTIIDSLTQIGYTVDIDIKDAQEFGVAQRRRRVFLVCARLDALLKQRTNLSKQISADLLSQILLNAWGATRQASSPVPLHSVYEKPIERCVNLLNKMTGLLEITRERLACKKYQNGLDALLDQFGGEGKNLEFGSIKKSEIQRGESSRKMAIYPSDLKAENGDTSISSWLSEYLGVVCAMGRGRTTSILRNRITDHQIYIFSVMALLIVERILLSTDWSESYWNAALSLSTLIQENMSYARQASNNLFVKAGLRDSWRDYLNSASNIQSEIEQRAGIISAAKVLFESESGAWDSPPRREAREESAAISGTLSANAGGTNRPAGNANELDFRIPVANTVTAGAGRSHHDHTQENLVARSQTSRNGRNHKDDNWVVNDGISPTLHTGMGHHGWSIGDQDWGLLQPIAFDWQSGGDNRMSFGLPNLQAHQTPAVAQPLRSNVYNNSDAGMEARQMIYKDIGVRRLTPLEAERLQGFPDGWTDGQSDSIRYRQLGNAVCVPVAKWIFKRIISQE